MKSDDGLEVERDMVDEEMRQGMVNGRMVGMGWTTRRRNRRRRRRVDDVHDLVAAVRSDDGRPVVLLSLSVSLSLSCKAINLNLFISLGTLMPSNQQSKT